MADSFNTTVSLSNQVLTAYDQNAYFALRDEAIWDQFADVKPGNLTNPGSPVTFTFWADLAEATTPLDEVIDVDAVSLSDSQVSVTPNEYGHAVVVSIRLETDDFLLGFDSDVANILSENMVKTIDRIARNAVDAAGTAVTIAASEGATVAGDVITAALVRQQRATLVGANVRPWGMDYAAIIDPDVGYDLQSETGDNAWGRPHEYVDTEEIYNGELGKFAGFRFIESNRVNLNVDGGSGSVDTYTTYFFGQQFLAKVESIAPRMVMGPVTDTLMRLRPLGWHGYFGFGEFRSASLIRLIGASSIGDNT